MILSLLLLMGMQPCHRVGGELKNCGRLEELVAHDPIQVPAPGLPTSGTSLLLPWQDAPEPLDVPAIHVFTEEEVAVRIHNFGLEYWRNPWTCKDETRILEHDEQDPPLYWCRKVQTGGKP